MSSFWDWVWVWVMENWVDTWRPPTWSIGHRGLRHVHLRRLQAGSIELNPGDSRPARVQIAAAPAARLPARGVDLPACLATGR